MTFTLHGMQTKSVRNDLLIVKFTNYSGYIFFDKMKIIIAVILKKERNSTKTTVPAGL